LSQLSIVNKDATCTQKDIQTTTAILTPSLIRLPNPPTHNPLSFQSIETPKELQIKSKMPEDEHAKKLHEVNEKLASVTQIGTGMKSTNLYEFFIDNQKRLDVINVLKLRSNDANIVLAKMTDQSNGRIPRGSCSNCLY
jgi:hypothetical protein